VNDGSRWYRKRSSKNVQEITDLSISKENGGLSSARNAGITISKGEYILPLDADDILHKII
jgi:glycosyltransferase involved in cell wall biosynthesis